MVELGVQEFIYMFDYAVLESYTTKTHLQDTKNNYDKLYEFTKDYKQTSEKKKKKTFMIHIKSI